MTRYLRLKAELELHPLARVRPGFYISDDEGDLVLVAFGSVLRLKIGTGRSW